MERRESRDRHFGTLGIVLYNPSKSCAVHVESSVFCMHCVYYYKYRGEKIINISPHVSTTITVTRGTQIDLDKNHV